MWTQWGICGSHILQNFEYLAQIFAIGREWANAWQEIPESPRNVLNVRKVHEICAFSIFFGAGLQTFGPFFFFFGTILAIYGHILGHSHPPWAFFELSFLVISVPNYKVVVDLVIWTIFSPPQNHSNWLRNGQKAVKTGQNNPIKAANGQKWSEND